MSGRMDGRMDARRTASAAAVVGGLGWLAGVALTWVEGTDPALGHAASVLGLVGLVVALAAAGYTLAEQAPVWLRAVVVVATPLLVVAVWVLLDEGVRAVYPGEGWLADEVTRLLTAVVALLAGAWGLRGRRGGSQAAPGAGHRAASRPGHRGGR
jgi:hypothetical protein